LLLLLHCNEAHGYDLLEGLKQFGFEQNPVDSSTVYRMLRGLEKRGFVTSRWDTGGGGPARRLYQITDEGDRYLAWWVQDLRETDRVLHHFMKVYDTHMEVHR
jgi:poly-beta-hydroxybutyrate-responsive repressor